MGSVIHVLWGPGWAGLPKAPRRRQYSAAKRSIRAPSPRHGRQRGASSGRCRHASIVFPADRVCSPESVCQPLSRSSASHSYPLAVVCRSRLPKRHRRSDFRHPHLVSQKARWCILTLSSPRSACYCCSWASQGRSSRSCIGRPGRFGSLAAAAANRRVARPPLLNSDGQRDSRRVCSGAGANKPTLRPVRQVTFANCECAGVPSGALCQGGAGALCL